MIRRLAGVVALAALGVACGHALFKPPAGPGLPAPNAAEAWRQATSTCRAAGTYMARLRVSGRAGDARIPPLAVDAAVTADQSIYLSATAAGRGIFVLAGGRERATLWLRREHRVVRAPPADLIDAILGVPLPPDRLLAVLSGCGTRAFDVVEATATGRWLSVATTDGRVYLERREGVWRTRAALVDDFIVEFLREGTTLPGRIWIRSTPGKEPRAALDVTVADAEQNRPVPAAVFEAPAGAADAVPMTLEELRRWSMEGRGTVRPGQVH